MNLDRDLIKAICRNSEPSKELLDSAREELACDRFKRADDASLLSTITRDVQYICRSLKDVRDGTRLSPETQKAIARLKGRRDIAQVKGKKKYNGAIKKTAEIVRGERTHLIFPRKGTYLLTVRPGMLTIDGKTTDEGCAMRDFVLQLLINDTGAKLLHIRSDGVEVPLQEPASGAGWSVFSVDWREVPEREMNFLIQTDTPDGKMIVEGKGRIR